MIYLPRIRGKTFKKDNGWSWKCLISMLGDNDGGIVIEAKDVLATKELAIEDLKKAVKLACDEIQLLFMGKTTGEYIDMKTNETLTWDKKDLNS